MDIKTAHCLFEQSGTFKNEFLKFGIKAYDYDISNDFGQTDYVIDLFDEIEKAYDDEPSIFDGIKSDDLIFAFFPCTRFSPQILLVFWGDGSQHKKLPMEQKLERDIELQNELTRNYVLVTKLALVCLKRNLRLIIENPYGHQHYLTTHWALKPSVIDMDRRKRGDILKKPTQFWFVNCEPENNLILETVDKKETTNISGMTSMERSLIQPEYANRFIREFIMGEIKRVDAFEYLEGIKPNSVDLIVLDPNYQDWDEYIRRGLLDKCMTVLKDTGNILCFTKQPFDYNLRIACDKWFRREITWTFENGGAWVSKKMPLVSTQKIYWLVKSDNFYFEPRTGEAYSEKTKNFKRNKKVFEGFCEEGHDFVKSEDGVWLRDHLHFNKPNSGAIPAKPKELIRIFLKCFTPPQGIVLDLFSGSGIIPVTCEEMGLNYMASEKETDRVEGIVKKLKETYPRANIDTNIDVPEEAQMSIFDFIGAKNE